MLVEAITAGVVLGAVSSLHCAQMCGPLVLAFSLRGPSSGMRGQFAYHAGRVAIYSLLGAIAGSAGSTLAAMAGARRGVTLAAGVLLILVGGLLPWLWPGSTKYVQIQTPGPLRRLSGRLLLAPGLGRRTLLGMAMGFLPCGLIYAALLQAATAGNSLDGAAGMAAFGLATSMPLLAIGGMSPIFTRWKWAKYTSALTSITLVLMGAMFLWRGVSSASPAATGAHPDSCHGHAHR